MVEAAHSFRFIGQGVYSMAEAGRLTKVPVRNLERWARGYRYTYRGIDRYSPPIIGSGRHERDGVPILEFRDIMEVRFLSAFRRAGVSWNVIRRVAGRVQQHIKHTHPFATRVFRTDGRHILLELITRDDRDHRLVDLISDQYEWNRVVGTLLVAERVEFSEEDEPIRWWPLGPHRNVVVDPARAFGAPIVAVEGVQTYLLARAQALENNIEFVAHWYQVTSQAVRDAVDFENGARATREVPFR